MRWLSRVMAFLRGAEDPGDELEFHVAELRRERMEAGDSAEDAERYARLRVGNALQHRETVRSMGVAGTLETVTRHLRIGWRTLARHRTASGFAVAVLALGIGMSAAMYSLVDAVILRPLPFPDQTAVQVIWKSDPQAGSHVEEMAYPELRDLQSVPDFADVALLPPSLYGYARVLQVDGAEPVQIEGTPVSHRFFSVLGVKPALGRDFRDADERVGAAPVVIVSDAVWRTHLGADPAVVGRLVRLNGTGCQVIGVLPAGAEFPRGAGLWVPLGVDARVVERRGMTFLMAVARLRPGRTAASATAQVSAVFARQARDFPSFYSASQRAVVMPLPEYWTGSARLHLLLLLGASVLLLAAAVLSAGNLILSRTMSRTVEIATRSALGASARQILMQLASEAVILAALAAALGLGVARGVIALLVRFAPADIPRLEEAGLHAGSLAFAVGAALVCALVCTVTPGWFLLRANLEAAMREGGGRAAGSRRSGRMQSVFVLSQAAVTVTLLVMGALLGMSYRGLMRTGTGFGNGDTVTMNLALRGSGALPGQAITVERRREFYYQLLEALRREAGVTSAGAVLVRPLEGPIGWDVSYQFEFAFRDASARQLPKANFEVITPGYLTTVGTPLLEGRDFTEADAAGTEKVAIISAALARQIREAGHEVLGHKIRLGVGGEHRIAGVTAEARYRSVAARGADVYVPYRQANAPTNYLVIRGSRPATELAELVKRKLAAMDAGQTVAGVATVGELIAANTSRHRFNMMLLICFMVCATVLAAMAISSVVQEGVALRRKEVAIKVAIGAGRGALLRDLMQRPLVFVVVGEALGLCAAAAIGHAAAGLLYEVTPADPGILGAVFGFLLLTSVAAAVVPAMRATAVDAQSLLR